VGGGTTLPRVLAVVAAGTPSPFEAPVGPRGRLRSSLGALHGAHGTPKDIPRMPQGPPRGAPGHPKDQTWVFILARQAPSGAPWGPQGGARGLPRPHFGRSRDPPVRTRTSQGCPMDPQGCPIDPRGRPRTPKEPPRDPQGPRLATQRSPRAPQGRPRGENDAKMTPNRPQNDAKTVPRPPPHGPPSPARRNARSVWIYIYYI